MKDTQEQRIEEQFEQERLSAVRNRHRQNIIDRWHILKAVKKGKTVQYRKRQWFKSDLRWRDVEVLSVIIGCTDPRYDFRIKPA